ncbi:hypothetical protein THRCLA_23092, partial [Thraustotheca clavata]
FIFEFSINMQQHQLGSQGLKVSKIGFGAMGMTALYGDFDREDVEETSIDTIGKALELGINLIDTAWAYQSLGADGKPNRTNEELIGKAIKRYGWDNYVRQQLAESLQRLDIDYVDLYYMHRVDPSTPIEETVKCLKQLVHEGKIKYIELSECSSDEIRHAHLMFARTWHWYSPLGCGLLTGAITSHDALSANDARRNNPRFVADSIGNNVPNKFFELAAAKNMTPAQQALAWLLHRGDDVDPIPGTKNSKRIIENAGAASIVLTNDELIAIEKAVPEMTGARYDEGSMNWVMKLENTSSNHS